MNQLQTNHEEKTLTPDSIPRTADETGKLMLEVLLVKLSQMRT